MPVLNMPVVACAFFQAPKYHLPFQTRDSCESPDGILEIILPIIVKSMKCYILRCK